MAELTINTQDIASAIRKNLDGFEPSLASGQVGRVVEVGDGSPESQVYLMQRLTRCCSLKVASSVWH